MLILVSHVSFFRVEGDMVRKNARILRLGNAI